jgi:hypothetical protein
LADRHASPVVTHPVRHEKSGTRIAHSLAHALGMRHAVPSLGALAVGRAVEVGLSVLGDSAMTATFFFMESNIGLARNRIPDDPDSFVGALRTIFGLGSRELLVSVLKALQDEADTLHGDKLLQGFEAAIREGIESVETGVI